MFVRDADEHAVEGSLPKKHSPSKRKILRLHGRFAPETSIPAQDDNLLRLNARLLLEEILDQFLAVGSEHALGMELHPFDGKAAMAKSHDDAGAIFFEGMGGDFEVGGQVFFGDDQGVVASSRHRGRNAPEDGPTVVLNLAGLAVHQVLRADDVSAEGGANGLMSQTYAEQRHFPAKWRMRSMLMPASCGVHGPGRNHNAVRVEPLDSRQS